MTGLCCYFHILRMNDTVLSDSCLHIRIHNIQCKCRTHTDRLTESSHRYLCRLCSCRNIFKDCFNSYIKVRHVECIGMISRIFKRNDLLSLLYPVSIFINIYKCSCFQLLAFCRYNTNLYFISHFGRRIMKLFTCCDRSRYIQLSSGSDHRNDQDIVRFFFKSHLDCNRLAFTEFRDRKCIVSATWCYCDGCTCPCIHCSNSSDLVAL